MNRITLKDCCTFQEGYVNPSQKIRDYFNGPIKWLRASDLNDGFVYNTEQTLSNKGFESAGKSAFLFNANTIAISKSGTIGRLGILKDRMCGNRAVINIDVNKQVADLFYVFYTLIYKKAEILSKAGGSIQKNLYVSALETISLNHKVLSTQKSIAKVLSDLDAKIELNNRINRELEAMAKTLYDYWFVQFDFPNEQGKPYKSSGGKMVYNADLKREIPEGWTVKKLSEIESNIITGKTPSTTIPENFGGNIPFITIDDIRGQLFILSAERTLSKMGADSQPTKYLKKGDVCVSCIGTIGVIGLVHQISQTNQQINTISIQKSHNRYFLLNALKNYFDFNVAAKKGAVLLNMNKAEFSDIPILDSISKIKEEYNILVEPIYNQVEINLKQNQQLTELRDWLLPMLMNGQVTVSEL